MGRGEGGVLATGIKAWSAYWQACWEDAGMLEPAGSGSRARNNVVPSLEGALVTSRRKGPWRPGFGAGCPDHGTERAHGSDVLGPELLRLMREDFPCAFLTWV